MSTQSPALKIRPSGKWYLLPAAMWLLALALFIVFVVSIVRFLSSDLAAVTNRGQVQVAAGGFTVYGESSIIGAASCTAVDDSGMPIALKKIGGNIELSTAGQSWRALALSDKDLPAGRYTLTCAGASDTLAVGDRIDPGVIAMRAIWGFVIPGVLGLAGLITIIVLAVKRGRSKAQVRQAQMYAADQGYGTAWQQMNQGGYPPPPPGYGPTSGPSYDPNQPYGQPPQDPNQPPNSPPSG